MADASCYMAETNTIPEASILIHLERPVFALNCTHLKKTFAFAKGKALKQHSVFLLVAR